MLDLYAVLFVLGFGVALARALRKPQVPWKYCRKHGFTYLYAKACPHCPGPP